MGGCYVKVAVKSVHCGARGAPIFSLVAGVVSKLVGCFYRRGAHSGLICDR